jgi:hypothetical protein
VRADRMAHAATPELRDAVRDYVRELRARGYPPERVLVAVKALTAEAGLKATGAWADVHSPSAHPEKGITDHVVDWCIGEYFRGPPEVG